jgi:dihydrofolate reductase
MRNVVVTMFMTLDGVIQDPHHWSFPYWNDDIAKFKYEELFASDALLLGRVTYEGFAEAWPQRDNNDPFTNRINTLAKYVVSTTLDKAEWNNSQIISANVLAEIKKLKQQDGMDIAVHGSATLVQTLIEHNLVDVYRLLVYPLVLGSGLRLFQEGSKTNLKRVEQIPFSTGVVGFIYHPA